MHNESIKRLYWKRSRHKKIDFRDIFIKLKGYDGYFDPNKLWITIDYQMFELKILFVKIGKEIINKTHIKKIIERINKCLN